LGEAPVGAAVLDLFAGTGSLAIEALSRGAQSAVLVEGDRKACAVIAENLKNTRLEAKVVCTDVFRFLQTGAGSGFYDLIFADPPYAKNGGARDFAAELLNDAGLARALKDDGMLVLEVGQRWVLPECPEWECVRRKRYGSTEALFFRKAAGMRGR
ncbi:MAG: 16S rRNA (guanine(966)-N(2))-methyltransferase RsmD, partial [Verrucomicrobia bacterium]|nr:16S rRNA (guanine(966)-N(2))-methyltransferase RsmD [Verrucomicrobiota bacterium]